MQFLMIDEEIEDLECIGQVTESSVFVLKLAQEDAKVFGTVDLKLTTQNDINGLIEHLYARSNGVTELEAAEKCITEKPILIMASLITGEQAVVQYTITQ